MSENFVNVNQLTQAQQHKFASLVGIYGEQDAFKIVNGLTERGRNSYASFIDKMNVFLRGLNKEQEDYYNELYKVFELDSHITTNDIIAKVVSTRRALEMDFYRSKLKVRCEADFFALFAVQEQSKTIDIDGESLETIFYVPFAKVKPKQLES